MSVIEATAMQGQTYRYGTVWRALGVTGIGLAAVLPVLMALNNEKFDRATVVILSVLGLAGIWCYAYFAKYAVTVGPEQMTVYRLGRRPLAVDWRDVRSVRAENDELRFEFPGGKVAIASVFPGYEAIDDAAARYLPDVAFETPEHRQLPEEPVEEPKPETVRAQHRAIAGAWRRLAYRCLAFAAALFTVAFLARAALTRIENRWLAWIVASLNSMGEMLGVFTCIAAMLFFIMSLQEVVRARRVR